MLRDEHRLREKIELSVDERQVAPLAIAALLLFGAVFAVGVYVGRGLSSAAPQQQPIGNLDALDQTKDAAVARPKVDEAKAGPAKDGAGAKSAGKGDPTLDRAANAKELAAAQDREGADEKARDEKAAQVEAQQKAAQVEAQQKAAQVEAQRKAAQVEGQRKAAQVEAQQRSDNEQAAKEKAARDRSAREKAARDKAALRAKALASVAAATGRPEEDSTGSEAPAAADVPAAAGPSGPGGEGSGESFTVQIGSAPDREGADKLVRKAREAGLKPYIVEAKIAGKGTWYRIRVGKFAEKSAAESLRREVERKLGGLALVMPAK